MIEKKNKRSKREKVSQAICAKSYPTISACIIVKDEEEQLPRCLKSIKDYVDEIIVVDTGSTDRTVGIAKSFGANIYQHPWEGDFSKHQNQSVKYATSDWVFQIDADEELKQGSGEVLRKAVTNSQIDSILITMISYFNNKSSQLWESKIRVFKNIPSIYYEGIVHQQLLGCKSNKLFPIYLYHYGYDLGKDAQRKKFKRTYELLKKQIREEPSNYWHRHNLSVCYANNFMFKEAIEEGLKAIDLHDKGNLENINILWTNYVVSASYYKLGELEPAKNYALKALSKFSNHLDSFFILVLVYHQKKEWLKLMNAAAGFIRVLDLLRKHPERFHSVVNNTANEEWRVRLALGDLYLERKEEKNANEEFNKAFLITPNRLEYNNIMGDIYRDRGLWERAEDNYSDSLKENPENLDALFGLALLSKGGGELVQYQMYLDKLRDMKTDDADILTEIGIYDLRADRYEQAIQNFKGVLAKRPHDVNTYINLALACKHSGQKEDAIGYNLKALGLKVDSIEALTNLGHIYFESEKYTSAKEIYLRALESGLDLIDVHLRLSHIYTREGEIEDCVSECDFLLKTLHLPRNKTLNSIKDLSELFLVIAHTLEQSGKEQLSREALEIAVRLNPDIVR